MTSLRRTKARNSGQIFGAALGSALTPPSVSDLGCESITQLRRAQSKSFVAGRSRNGMNRGTLNSGRRSDHKGSPIELAIVLSIWQVLILF
jgi:hypothetical protein